jgi:hypothetical protein
VLLEAICFDMSVRHPHTCLIEFSSIINGKLTKDDTETPIFSLLFIHGVQFPSKQLERRGRS